MPERPIAGRQHGEDRRRRQHVDRRRRADGVAARHSPTASSAAARRRAPPTRARPARRTHRREDRRSCAGATAWRGRRAARRAGPRPSRRRAAARCACGAAPRGSAKRLGVLAPAFEAGPMAGGERGHLVEEEQFGVAVAPDVALPVLELRARQQIHCARRAAPAPSVRSSRWKRPPRLPMNRPRAGSANSSPNGSTRFCRGMVTTLRSS